MLAMLLSQCSIILHFTRNARPVANQVKELTWMPLFLTQRKVMVSFKPKMTKGFR